MFADAQLMGTHAYATSPADAGLGATGSQSSLVVGASAQDVAGGSKASDLSFYNGRIDELQIWTVAAADIATYTMSPSLVAGDLGLMNSTDTYRAPKGSEEGLVGYWSFNEGRGTVAMDSSSSIQQRAPLFGTLFGSGAFWSDAAPDRMADTIETWEGTPVSGPVTRHIGTQLSGLLLPPTLSSPACYQYFPQLTPPPPPPPPTGHLSAERHRRVRPATDGENHGDSCPWLAPPTRAHI